MRITKAILIAKIPEHRFCSFDGSVPEVGDQVEVDQEVTFPDGQPGCIVYSSTSNGEQRYEAEVYEHELGDA
jgi:hypothetical protein